MNYWKISLFLILSLFTACSADDELLSGGTTDTGGRLQVNEQTNILTADTLRILDIGNSYTEDYTYLLPQIVENLGGDMKHTCYYNLVRGSGSFKTWYDCYFGKDNVKFYCQKVFGNIDQDVPIGNFEPYDSETLKAVLSAEWDLIVLHSVSNYSTNYDIWWTQKTGGYLNELLALLKESQPQAHFAFVLTHSYEHTHANNAEHSTYQRWLHIADAANRVMNDRSEFELLIPYGTAIENLRSSRINTEHDLTRDGTHLGRGLARYAAALTVYQTLFRKRTGRNIEDCTVMYTCPQWEIDGSKYEDGYIDVTNDNYELAIGAAMSACEDYFRVISPDGYSTGIPQVIY